MTHKYHQIDNWYFGDYTGGVAGKSYNFLVYAAIVLLLSTIAVSTEASLPSVFKELYVPYSYNLIEIFFMSDMIGKISNSWAKSNYSLAGLISSSFGVRQLCDFIPLVFLVTNYFDNESLPIISLYIIKILALIYYSELRVVLDRLKFIFFDQPSKTFFPLMLLSIVTYVMASVMYIIEAKYNPEYFGSILRSLWFSFVSATTIGYGDVTPSTAIGKILTMIFALFGIVCVAILTANIIEMNSKYDQQETDY